MKFLAKMPRVFRIILGALIVVLGAGLVLAATQMQTQAEEAPRIGFDPLSAAEQQRALATALAHTGVTREIAAGARSEVLLVENHEESKEVTANGSWPRRADVYIYNYDRDALVYALVSVAAGTVDSVEVLQGVQLSFTDKETAAAMRLALADETVGAAIRQHYEAAAGRPLNNPDELRVTAYIFRADDVPPGATGADSACGQQRCAEFLLSTTAAGGVLLNVIPIVNLSSGEVVGVGNFQGG